MARAVKVGTSSVFHWRKFGISPYGAVAVQLATKGLFTVEDFFENVEDVIYKSEHRKNTAKKHEAFAQNQLRKTMSDFESKADEFAKKLEQGVTTLSMDDLPLENDSNKYTVKRSKKTK